MKRETEIQERFPSQTYRLPYRAKVSTSMLIERGKWRMVESMVNALEKLYERDSYRSVAERSSGIHANIGRNSQ